MATLLLGAALAAQRREPALSVGELGAGIDGAIALAAPDYWGAVLVARDGKPVFARGYGALDRGAVVKGKEVTALSLFDIGGAVQQLAQMLALRLCADRKLRLEDPLAKLLPNWPADKAAITVDQLLLHTSGMPTETTWPSGAHESAKGALAAMAGTPLAAMPGEKFAYSDLNATLLALVLEGRGGGAFDKLLAQKVLDPFGMATAVPCNGRCDGKLVTWRLGKGLGKGEPATGQNCNWQNRGVRAMLASVHDVHALFARLCEGKLFDARERDLLWRPIATGALRRERAALGGRTLLRVTGYAGGYCTMWTLDPDARDWVVVMTGDDAAAAKVTIAVVAVLGPATTSAAASPAAPAAPAAPPRADPAAQAGRPRFVGEFALPTGGRFAIALQGDGLRLEATGVEPAVRLALGSWVAAAGAAAARHEDRGVALLQRLAAGDVTALDDGFGAAGGAAAEATSAAIAAFLAEHGALQRCEFVGDEAVAAGARSWFRLRGERGAVLLVADWRDDRHFARCEAAAAPPPFALELTLVAPDRAVGTAAGGAAIVCTVEGEGDRRVLVFEDGTPGPDGLLECRLVTATAGKR